MGCYPPAAGGENPGATGRERPDFRTGKHRLEWKMSSSDVLEPQVSEVPSRASAAAASRAAIAHPRKVWRGWPYPLGATWTGAGVNFSI